VARGLLRDSLKVQLPLKEFPGQGIAVITLYDEKLQPVAERLVYVHPEKKLCITATTDKKNYLTREKVSVKIRTTDEKGNPVAAHLGISVYDPYYGNPEDPTNILTHAYLSSQIRGKLYDPGYYFDEKNSGREVALDLLLLTQGWRRYVWQPENLTPHGPDVVYDEITGIQKVKKKKNDQAVLQVIKVSDADKNTQFITVDSAGYFAVDASLLKTFNSGYLYLKPMLPEKFNPALVIDDPFEAILHAKKIKKAFYPLACPDFAEAADERPLVTSQGVILLNEVIVTGKSGKIIRDKYMGQLDSLAQMHLGPWVCEEGHLENYLPGYTHHHDPRYCPCPVPVKQRSIPVKGKLYALFKPKYFDNCKGKGGGCCFMVLDRIKITYSGPVYSDEELLRMNGLWRTKGYYGVREFYQPDEVDMQSSLPDSRNTLFRSPSVVTDENGEATVSFYSSDLNTGFVGRIEGTDGMGLLGMSAFDFRVLKVPVFGKENE
jgi:hypothetical protein